MKKWNFSLRCNNSNYIGNKKGYVTLGTDNAPKWTKLNDHMPKEEERVIKVSERESPEHKLFLSNPYLQEKNDFDSIKKAFDDLQGLSLIKRGLLELERDNAKSIKGKKKLFKFV